MPNTVVQYQNILRNMYTILLICICLTTTTNADQCKTNEIIFVSLRSLFATRAD